MLGIHVMFTCSMKVVQASKRKTEKTENPEKDSTSGDMTPSTSAASIDIVPPGVSKSHDEEDDDEGDSSDSDAKDGGGDDAGSSGKRMPKTLFGITAGEIESISKEVSSSPECSVLLIDDRVFCFRKNR